MAHEINNPLTVILGNSQLMLRSIGADNHMRPLLESIYNCGIRCSRIVKHLLAFARQDEHTKVPTSVNDLVERVISLLRHELERVGVEVECEMADGLPAVLANEYQIEQVLINLLLNARDAVATGPAHDKVVRVRTQVMDRPEGPCVAVTVADHGPGIPDDVLPKLFEPFFTTKEPGKGTGLGLWVSLGIAEAHGGTIEVHSAVGQGSAFTFLIPIQDGGGQGHGAG